MKTRIAPKLGLATAVTALTSTVCAATLPKLTSTIEILAGGQPGIGSQILTPMCLLAGGLLGRLVADTSILAWDCTGTAFIEILYRQTAKPHPQKEVIPL